MTFLRRLLWGHRLTFISTLIGIVAFLLLPRGLSGYTRGIVAWDAGAFTMLLLCAWMFLTSAPNVMEAHAEAQEDGEWTLFWLVVAGATASFAAIVGEFSTMKDISPALREAKVALVGVTLAASWMLTHAVFALRYAHEFYTRTGNSPHLDRGLEFPSEDCPDYWDFFYFSAVLGMTFQVSDVQITSRKFRRLATLHGMLGFGFNTVIVALTVNLASGLLT